MKSLPVTEIFLALRYLRPKRTFVSVITLLSILGPILGVALLVIVTAVMSGFDQNIRERILSMQAHLMVFPPAATGTQPAHFTNPAAVLRAVEAAGARGAPLIEGPVMLQMRDQVGLKYVRGIRPEYERQVNQVAAAVRGKFDIREGEAILGEELAREFNLRLGSKLLIHSPAKLTRNLRWTPDGKVQVLKQDEVYLPEEVTVAGIFSMGVYDFDSNVLFIHIDQAADLFGLPMDSAGSVQVRVPDPFHLEPAEAAIRSRLPECGVRTWQEANRQLFGALKVEKNLMFFLLFFIVLVAAFGIAGTLITVVVQKTREIGILKAVGMPGGVIARIFLLQGAVIGVIGTALGMGAGLLVVHYRNGIAWLLGRIMGVDVFPKEMYQLSQIPARLMPSDLLIILGISFLLCIAGAVIPALFAAALSPAHALREEN